MSHHYPRRSFPYLLGAVLRAIPWRFLFILPILAVIAIPTFLFGTHMGIQVLPSVTQAFYNMTGPPPPPAPTPQPSLLKTLPQPGSLAYTVQSGDSCVGILEEQMRMSDAGVVFSDIKPAAVHALSVSIGKDCHALQPGNVLKLSPHYPLVALGGVVMKVVLTNHDTLSAQQIASQKQSVTDCSQGCSLLVRIAAQVQVHLSVQTGIPLHPGAWVWVQAMLPQQRIKNVDSYPYVSSTASLDGMNMRVCDLQVDQTHDANSSDCNQLTPNTINDDGGAWMFGVTGANSLNHWKFGLKEPPGTQVLVWLSQNANNQLVYQKGSPVYRYNENTRLYERG